MLRPFLYSSSILLAVASTGARAMQADPQQAPAAPAGATLPAGDDAQFRAKMLAWSHVVPAERWAAEAVDEAGMARPVATGRLTSSFGLRSDPIEGGVRSHAGIDIAGPWGTPVRAAADGVVSFAGTAGGYGSLVRLDHGGGLQSRYGHLSRILASAGEPVHRGDVIGLMGSTGRSTGSHLHFEVRLHGRPLDPQRSLAEGVAQDGAAPLLETAPAAPVAARWQGLRQAEGRLPSAY